LLGDPKFFTDCATVSRTLWFDSESMINSLACHQRTADRSPDE